MSLVNECILIFSSGHWISFSKPPPQYERKKGKWKSAISVGRPEQTAGHDSLGYI